MFWQFVGYRYLPLQASDDYSSSLIYLNNTRKLRLFIKTITFLIINGSNSLMSCHNQTCFQNLIDQLKTRRKLNDNLLIWLIYDLYVASDVDISLTVLLLGLAIADTP
jgi:hypothetical protein